MARYIDREKALSELQKFSIDTSTQYGCGYSDCLTAVEDALNDLPAAEVAPKSEVAREIFEAIDKIIIACRVDEYSKEFGYIVRQNYNGASIMRGLAELKKKYTEEKE